jgi:hypothetical protein
MAQSRKRRPIQSTVHIPLGAKPTEELCTAVLTQFMRHLLFVRGQLPALYDNLLQMEAAAAAAAASKAVPKRLRGNRRTAKFVANAELLFSSLSAGLLSPTQPTSFFLLLGPSTTAPREAYEFVFPPATLLQERSANGDAGCEGQGGKASSPRLAGACRRALREYAMRSFDLPEGSAAERRCKIYFLAQAGALGASGEGAQQAGLPPAFSVRREWRLRMRRGTHTRIIFHESEQECDAAQQREQKAAERQGDGSGSGSGGGGGGGGTWLQSQAKLQGLVQPTAAN